MAILSSGSLKAEDILELETVNVEGKPDKPNIEKTDGFNLQQIDTSGFFNFNKNINQVLNIQPGIITRQKGSLGSETELSINGLSGKQIRYFIDGIPMENFGSALSFDDIPINMVTGISVYKGVVPISLSSDALGGAVDIKTSNIREDFLNASLVYGSFNTTKASVMTQVPSLNKKRFLRLSGFYNYSDNDYMMHNAPDTDSVGNKKGTKAFRRFHDQYRSHMFNIKAGLSSLDWADELSLSLISAGNFKQEQHPSISVNQVYGQYHRKNDTLLYSSTYRLNRDDFSIKAYLLTGKTKETYIDTASRSYRWDGSYTKLDSQLGELASRSILSVKDELLRTNVSGRYSLAGESSLGLSISHNDIKRSGKDEINISNPIYPRPNRIQKQVLAADYSQSWFDNTISSTLFVKNYMYDATVVSTEIIDLVYQEVKTEVDLGNLGYGAALQLNLSGSITGKLSYEKAFRMPETDELMGNGQFILASPNLSPEKSDNINFSLLHKYQYDNTYVSLESGLFYRNAKDFIHYVPTQNIRGKYLNVNNVQVKGVELSGLIEYERKYSLQAGLSYQDLRDKREFYKNGERNVNYNSQIPNIPYLFANARLGWSYYTKQFNKFATYLSGNYVHEYFLDWENLGSKKSKNIIPTQMTYDLEFEYTLYDIGLSATLAINNLSDARVFDNFNIQKPGRAYYMKLTYSY